MPKIVRALLACLFLVLPFLALNILRKFPVTSLAWNTELDYLIIILLGVGVAFWGVKSAGAVNESKKRLLLTGLKIWLIAYALFIITVTLYRFATFASQSVDVTYYHSAIWQLSEFKLPRFGAAPQRFVWGDHFEPIILFLVPVYWLIKSTTLLMLFQALGVISGIIPIYLVAKRTLKSRFIGLALAFAYVSFGGLQYGIEYGFHPIMFFPTVFFWLYYFYASKRIKLYYFFVLLCLFVKEEAAFILFSWGLYLVLVKKQKVMGAVTGSLALMWYLFCFQLIFPHFQPGGFGHWGQYSGAEGSGLTGIAKLALFQPLTFLRTLFAPAYRAIDPNLKASYKIDTVFLSFGTFSFLPFLYPPALLFVLPSLLEKLLSTNLAGVSGTHYSAAITGVTVIASVEALLFLSQQKIVRRLTTGRGHLFFGGLIFYVALFANTLNGYHPYSLYDIGRQWSLPPENLSALQQVLQQIPPAATISTQYQIIPHLPQPWGKVTAGPAENETADYVVIDQVLPPVLTTAKEINNHIGSLVESKNYEVVFHGSGVVVFKKITSHL